MLFNADMIFFVQAFFSVTVNKLTIKAVWLLFLPFSEPNNFHIIMLVETMSRINKTFNSSCVQVLSYLYNINKQYDLLEPQTLVSKLCEKNRVSSIQYTAKKENLIFLICKEIQCGAVAKSHMTNGLLIYGEIFAHFLIY